MAVIYVDADACPVKEEVVTIALRHHCAVFMVCNGGIRPYPHELIQLKIVSSGADEADKWIAEKAGKGDIIITNDMPLAEAVIAKEAVVLRPDGSLLDERNIGNHIATRDLMSDIRASDPFHISKSKPFSKSDRGRFRQMLDQHLNKTK